MLIRGYDGLSMITGLYRLRADKVFGVFTR